MRGHPRGAGADPARTGLHDVGICSTSSISRASPQDIDSRAQTVVAGDVQVNVVVPEEALRGTIASLKQARVTSAEFRNFKGLKHFTIALQHMNVLVGPNNCGKSTIIGSFRLLGEGFGEPALECRNGFS